MDKFVDKYEAKYNTVPVRQLHEFLVQRGVKQNVIQYFFKKEVFFHPDLNNILNVLVELKNYPLESIHFANFSNKTPHYPTIYWLTIACIRNNIKPNVTKDTITSFVLKTKNVQVSLLELKDYFDAIAFFPDKPCTIVNLIVDLYIKGVLSSEACQYVVSMKQQNVSDKNIVKHIKSIM